MPVIDIEALRSVARIDPEFSRAMRYFSGTIKLSVGEQEHHFLGFSKGTIQDGEPASEKCAITVAGTVDHWNNLLEAYPRPFYQCLQSTAVKHGLQLSETNETFSYLPALNRMVQLLRGIRKGG